MHSVNILVNSIQNVMLISIAISAMIMGLHRFFIGELVEYESPLIPYYKDMLMVLLDKYNAGQKWAIIYKPLGGCLYCFAFWVSITPCFFLAYNSSNILFLPMPFFVSLVSSVLNKLLNQ